MHRSVDPRDVEVVLTSAKDVRNHYIPRVDHNILEGGRVVDSHQDPVYCSKAPRHQALCDRRLPRYFLHPREIHVWEEVDYSIDRQGENAVALPSRVMRLKGAIATYRTTIIRRIKATISNCSSLTMLRCSSSRCSTTSFVCMLRRSCGACCTFCTRRGFIFV